MHNKQIDYKNNKVYLVEEIADGQYGKICKLMDCNTIEDAFTNGKLSQMMQRFQERK